jgi:hypothetical protein
MTRVLGVLGPFVHLVTVLKPIVAQLILWTLWPERVPGKNAQLEQDYGTDSEGHSQSTARGEQYENNVQLTSTQELADVDVETTT